MQFSTALEWLSWIASIHLTEIELGLDRVKKVGERLKILSPMCPVITVAGTNGKGSTVAGLEAIYRAANYQVGTFTSPFLFKHNEQVKINGNEASDAEFCAAFSQVESNRGDISLTPFEYHTLAALLIFQSYSLDVLILEVGLGGRLDAVNIIDADIAIVTSIGIDHIEWLGSTREEIGFEKAGIFRKNKPAVCGDVNPPTTLIEQAKQLGAPLFIQGKDFFYQEKSASEWSWQYQNSCYDKLPKNALASQNMSTVLMAITLLQSELPISDTEISKGLSGLSLPGRIQIIPGKITHIFDVAHNPHAILHLATQLSQHSCPGKTHAVFSMLADKDMLTSIKNIAPMIDHWHVAPLAVKRAASIEKLQEAFAAAYVNNVVFHSSIKSAYEAALNYAEQGDRILVFGSFHTVAQGWIEFGRLG